MLRPHGICPHLMHRYRNCYAIGKRQMTTHVAAASNINLTRYLVRAYFWGRYSKIVICEKTIRNLVMGIYTVLIIAEIPHYDPTWSCWCSLWYRCVFWRQIALISLIYAYHSHYQSEIFKIYKRIHTIIVGISFIAVLLVLWYGHRYGWTKRFAEYFTF